MSTWSGSEVFILLIFACATLAAYQAQLGGSALIRARRSRSRYEKLGVSPRGAEGESLRRRAAGRSHYTQGWTRLVLQSGVQIGLGAWSAWIASATLLVFLILPGAALPRLVAAHAAAWLGTVLYLRIRRTRRQARFGEQLPEVIDVIVRSLRAGHPLPISLALVARETPAPAGPEFALAIDEMNYGRSIAEALGGLHERVGHPDLAFLVAAVSIAHQTGGNLGEILARLARLLRERMRLARKVRALTAEGRFSGYALSAMPVLLFGAVHLVSPSYYAEFWQSPAAPTVSAVAIGLLVVGNLMILQFVNFKV